MELRHLRSLVTPKLKEATKKPFERVVVLRGCVVPLLVALAITGAYLRKTHVGASGEQ